ncbi:MAG: hypothetical protein A2284_08215 [Deltaproteobacteria bacterium RIFOXYA12_FULL_61_11]|nr:MAG: hypothetical protein A2284_08215 [Deltaproteobacteria bacterium RIFOXYA12_FULL_61_11]
MLSEPLLGDEVVARAALDAGLRGAYSYPGTPATELLEYLQGSAEVAKGEVHASWSANEKVALEEALGHSLAGYRALVAMKHVGLNVALDPFVSSALTGSNGGFLVVVADDPGMHSSQNEQDSRVLAEFAGIPCLEPAEHQELYEAVQEGFSLSEDFRVPVMLRLTTRLAHCRAQVHRREPQPPRARRPLPERFEDWILLPVNARRRLGRLLETREKLMAHFDERAVSEVQEGVPGPLGVIAAGLGYAYFREHYPDPGSCPPHLHVRRYPLAPGALRALARKVDEVLVLEDGSPYVERALSGLLADPRVRVRGKLSGDLPRTGELTPELVGRALGFEGVPSRGPSMPLPGRPPSLCKGCGHADLFKALTEVRREFPGLFVTGDIGCYTLGALPPYQALQTCVAMGASIGMARGMADAGVLPVVAVLGESTFAHSGIPALLSALRGQVPMTVIILDNAAVAMTGGQQSLLSGEALLNLLAGLGVDPEHLHSLLPRPQDHAANVEVLRKALRHQGLSVVVAARECLQAARRRKRGLA